MRPFASLVPVSAVDVGADPAGKPMSSGRTVRFGVEPYDTMDDAVRAAVAAASAQAGAPAAGKAAN